MLFLDAGQKIIASDNPRGSYAPVIAESNINLLRNSNPVCPPIYNVKFAIPNLH
jgi:hypothetical protein